MTAAELEAYARQVGDLPILGNIVFFTVREKDYDRAQMATWFVELGLRPELLPPPGTPVNAYRKACTAANEKVRYAIPGTDTTAHILVRGATGDKEGMSRFLVREVLDGKNRRVSYQQVGEVRFYHGTVRSGRTVPGSERLRLTIDHDKLEPYEDVLLKEVTGKIDADYDRFRRYMDSMKVRGVVRDYLRALAGVPLRLSTFFVHDSHSEELSRLRELMLRLGCDMDRVPLLELTETKDMLVKAVVTDTNDELQGVIDDIVELRKNRKQITGHSYARVKDRYARALAQAGQFTAWLDATVDASDATLEMAKAQLAQLQKDMIG